MCIPCSPPPGQAAQDLVKSIWTCRLLHQVVVGHEVVALQIYRQLGFYLKILFHIDYMHHVKGHYLVPLNFLLLTQIQIQIKIKIQKLSLSATWV